MSKESMQENAMNEEEAVIEASRAGYERRISDARSFLEKIAFVSPIGDIEEEAQKINAIVDAAKAGGAEDIARAKETIMKMYNVGPNTAIAMAADNYAEADENDREIKGVLNRYSDAVKESGRSPSGAKAQLTVMDSVLIGASIANLFKGEGGGDITTGPSQNSITSGGGGDFGGGGASGEW